MNKKYLILIGVIVIVFIIASTQDVFAGMLDPFGSKKKPKPDTQGG